MSARKRRQRRSADTPATPEKPDLSDDPAELRRRAEERLRVRKRAETFTDGAQRVVHELEVHQIELEMQNAELHTARNELEAALERYTDLYDFAPVGYLTVDESVHRASEDSDTCLATVTRYLSGPSLPEIAHVP